MSRGVLEVRGVTDEQKLQLQAIALRKLGKASASHLVKDLIAKTLLENDSIKIKPINLDKTQTAITKKRRLEVGLLPGEDKALDDVASKHLSSPNYYVTSLIRAHLSKEPQLLGDEIEAIRASNYQLLSIGRNINQIARQMNSFYDQKLSPHDIKYISEQISILNEVIQEHTKKIGRLVESNLSRWDISK